MEGEASHDEKHFRLKLDTSGRIVLPAGSKLRRECQAGQILIAVEDRFGRLTIRNYRDVMQDVQRFFADQIPEDRDLVSELIEERRQEAASE